MKLKKVLVLMMAAAMAMSTLAACSSGGDETTAAEGGNTTTAAAGEDTTAAAEGGESAASGETITFPLAETMEFTSFSCMNQDYALGDTLAMQTAMENANINITFNSVLSADLVEKRNLILASGEYPDMFFKSGLGMTDLNKYGAQGIFIPLEDLIKQYAPNFSALMDELDGWQYITSPTDISTPSPRLALSRELIHPTGSTRDGWITWDWKSPRASMSYMKF